MAKLKNTDNVSESEVSEVIKTIEEGKILPNTSSNTETKDIAESEITAPIQRETEKLPTRKGAKKSYNESPNNFTLEILKAYSNYETLYVDKLGCAYSSDTPEAIRGSAVLYKNPHFKPE